MLSAPLWDRCLSQLESELSEQQLNTWIRPLQAQQAQSHLKIMAPNRFVRDMVQDNFYPRIQEIAGSLNEEENIKGENTTKTLSICEKTSDIGLNFEAKSLIFSSLCLPFISS